MSRLISDYQHNIKKPNMNEHDQIKKITNNANIQTDGVEW